MQGVSGGFTTATTAAGARVCCCVEVSWDGTGVITAARGGAGWTDETARVQSYTLDLRLNAPGDELVPPGDIGRATIVFENNDQRFSWRNAASALAARIGGAVGLTGYLVRIWSGFYVTGSPEYVRIFTGVISGFTEQSVAGTVEAECRDLGYLYLQNKVSSASYERIAVDDWINDLADLAGIGAGANYRLLDRGIFRPLWVWADDESALDEMWEVARSDGGCCYFDQLGRLRFENLVHWASHALAFTFTASSYSLAQPQANVDDVLTRVTAEWSPRTLNDEATVYELDKARNVRPGETVSWECRYANPVKKIFAPEACGVSVRDYKAYTDGGIDMTAQITVTIPAATSYAQKCQIQVTNNHTTHLAHLGYLRIRGEPLLGGPTEQIEVAASAPPFTFERRRQMRANPYTQTDDQARALATYYAQRNQRLRPTYAASNGIGVPQLELGDRVALVDTAQFGATPLEGYVTALRLHGNANACWLDEAQVLDATSLYPATNLYYVGITTLGNGVCWY